MSVAPAPPPSATRDPRAGAVDDRAARGEGPAPSATRVPHMPGLDGLRALALAGVLVFHQGFPWARGGFLGVSTFFTLSGFLIASLAIDERARTGRLSWGRFWERRARRLLPAALAALAGIAVLQVALGVGSGPTYRGDVLASLTYVANWRFVAGSGDYALLFTDPSPVTHMWSLAIEEQFYLVFPLAFAGVSWLVTRRGRGRGAAAAVFAALGLASFAAAWAMAGDGDGSGLVYFATTTRAGELLAGVVLADAVTAGRVRGRMGPAAPPWIRRAAAAGGVVGTAGLLWLWHATTLASPALFRGATAANAACTCLVIVGATVGGPVTRGLGARPLRALGRVSYGAYLYHWPIFLVVSPARTGLWGHPWRLFALRVALTLVVAGLSYVLIEAPVRFRLRVPRRRLAAGLATAMVAVAALVVLLPVRSPAGGGVGAGDEELGWTVDATGPDATRVLLTGDSIAWSLGPAMSSWNRDEPDEQVQVEAYTPFGCPIGGFDTPVRINGSAWRGGRDCNVWHATLPAITAEADVDVVVFSSGVFEMGERRFAGSWYHVGDPVYDRWLRGRVDEVADLLAATDAPVVWLTHPHIRLHDPTDETVPWDAMDENDPARVDRLNQIVEEVVGDRPGFHLVDLAGWTEDMPGGEFDPEMRDGVHYRWGAAHDVGRWLVPRVLDVADGASTGSPPEG